MNDGNDRLASLAAVLKVDPDNSPVRLELARLLLAAGRGPEALEHARAVLVALPTNLEALQLAAKAAQAAGQSSLAQGYVDLVDSLTGHPQGGGPEPETTPHEVVLDDNEGEREPTDGEKYAPAGGEDLELTLDEESQRTGETRLRLVHGSAADDAGVYEETEEPGIRLSDVAGLEDVKRRLELAFLAPLRNPEIGRMYRKSLRGGLLLYGPPGCGKTYLARATAGELEARFLSIGLTDILDMYIGESESKLHQIFEMARRQTPCVVFIDEIDALGRKRSLMRHSPMTGVVTQFLAELDGVDTDNEGLFVLAATNHPWDVDSALRRPGRLDRTLLVLPPDRPARRGILASHLQDRPTEGLDLDWVAARTDGYSGADLAHVCESSAEMAMADSIESGTARPIRQKDLKKALKEVRPSTRSWFDTARNYALFNNEGGAYDDLVAYLREKKLG